MHEIESEEKTQEFDYYVCLIERCAHVDIRIILQQLLNINKQIVKNSSRENEL
jgi:hypothetical protein